MDMMLEITVKLRNNVQKSPIRLHLSCKCMFSQNGDKDGISCYKLAREK